MSMTVDELNVVIEAQATGFQAELNKIANHMNGFSRNVSSQTKNMGSYFEGLASKLKQVTVALGAGAVIKKSIQDYNTFSSVSIGLQSILSAQGRSFETAKTFLDGYTKDGLIPLADATTAYKNLLARGYDDAQIKDVLTSLKDASAFGRQSSLSIGEAVKSASEGLKNENSILVDNAGVTKNVAKMWEEYGAKIGKGSQQLTQAEKIQAEYNGIMEETRFQTGDAALYAGTLGGQFATLGAKLRTASSALGEVFAPMLQAVMPYLISFIDGITTALNVVAEFTKVLFGGSDSQTQSTKTANDAAKAQTALGEATKKAGKATSRSVAGFDEINQLQESIAANAEDAAAGLSDSASAGVGGKKDQKKDNPLSEVAKNALEIRNAIIGAFQDISDWFTNNKDIIISALAGIAAGFAGFLIAANWGAIVSAFETLYIVGIYVLEAIGGALAAVSLPAVLIGAAIAALTGAFVYFYSTNESFKGVVDGVLNSIKDVAIFLWQSVLVPLGQFIAGVFVAAWNGLVTVMSWLYSNVLIPIGNFLYSFWLNLLVPIGNVIGGILVIAFEALAKTAKSFWENVMVPLGNFFKDEFQPVLDTLKIVLESLWTSIFVPFGTFLSDTFTPLFSALGTAITTVWDTVLKPLAKFIGEEFFNAFDNVFKSVGDLIDDFKLSFNGVLTFIQGVFTGNWEKAWKGVKDIFKGIIDGLEDVFKAPLNGIIGLINGFLDYLATLKFTIPSADIPGLGKVGGYTIGFPKIDHIPRLAKGGITTGPTLAQIGERGTEAVIPLENGGGFVDTLASAIGSAVMGAMQLGNNSNSGNKEVVFQIDGTQFARVILPAIQKEQSRLGNVAILQGI